MKNILLIPIVILFGCGEKQQPENSQTAVPVVINTTPRVTGVGGIFFKCKDTGKMKEWYGKNLGLVTDESGTLFESRNTDDPKQKTYLQWSPFSEKTTYFAPSEKDFMVNFRVVGMEKLVEELKRAGVQVLDTIQTFDYGKFIHIMDPEGNKIELWEPIDNDFTRAYEGKTTH